MAAFPDHGYEVADRVSAGAQFFQRTVVVQRAYY